MEVADLAAQFPAKAQARSILVPRARDALAAGNVAQTASCSRPLARSASTTARWSVTLQHRAQNPHLKVSHSNVMPVWGGTGRNLAGSTLGDLWFAIEVYNDGLVPVSIRSVGIAFEDGGTAPFFRPPWPGVDELPKDLAPGDEATFYLDPVEKIAEVHAEHRAKWVYVRLGGKVEFHGKRIDKKWLDGWVKSGVSAT